MVRHDLIVALSLYVIASASAFIVGPARIASRPLSPLCAVPADPQGVNNPEENNASGGEEHALPSESDTDILNSPAFLKRKLEVLKSDIAQADADVEALKVQVEEGKAEWGQQLDDLQLEYEKIQERMKVQNEGGDDEATVKVVRQMLGVLDNYDRAFGVLTAETDEQKEIEDAYRATYDKILATFESLGVTEVETVGAEFDYEVHQAVMQRPSDDYEEGIVCEELAKGFVLEDKLIRAAMVSVAA